MTSTTLKSTLVAAAIARSAVATHQAQNRYIHVTPTSGIVNMPVQVHNFWECNPIEHRG